MGTSIFSEKCLPCKARKESTQSEETEETKKEKVEGYDTTRGRLQIQFKQI
jgi:hypothetical protein